MHIARFGVIKHNGKHSLSASGQKVLCKPLCMQAVLLRSAIIIMQAVMHTSCFAPFSYNYYAYCPFRGY